MRTCGKLWMLDRMLIKLRAGHRVLLFSTMTKLLDLLETYLKWRMTTPAGEGMEWCRIDGSTALDPRRRPSPRSAAGFQKVYLPPLHPRRRRVSTSRPRTPWWFTTRTQTRRTRSRRSRGHRIGQRREVRVLYMEAVMDEIGAADDEGGIGGSGHGGAGRADTARCAPRRHHVGGGGTRTFPECLERVVRIVVQQQKIELADEVLNAGRLDQQTSHAERRETLEKLMQEQATAGARSCASMSLRTLNEKLARTPQEVELFNEMDLRADLWPGTLTVADETPGWIRYKSRQGRGRLLPGHAHQARSGGRARRGG